MKALDTTRISQEQLALLALILKSLDDRMSATMLGQRMRLSNIEHKKP